jgi:hypothetical protein
MLDVLLKVSIVVAVVDAVLLAWVLISAQKAKGGWYGDLD